MGVGRDGVWMVVGNRPHIAVAITSHEAIWLQCSSGSATPQWDTPAILRSEPSSRHGERDRIVPRTSTSALSRHTERPQFSRSRRRDNGVRVLDISGCKLRSATVFGSIDKYRRLIVTDKFPCGLTADRNCPSASDTAQLYDLSPNLMLHS